MSLSIDIYLIYINKLFYRYKAKLKNERKVFEKHTAMDVKLLLYDFIGKKNSGYQLRCVDKTLVMYTYCFIKHLYLELKPDIM